MNQTNEETPADALIALLKSSLTSEAGLAFGHMVLYTSFGVVRGRTGLGFAHEMARQTDGEPDSSPQVIELNEVTVEHYSNHLPTASFDRLYVRLRDIQGFALINPQTEPGLTAIKP